MYSSMMQLLAGKNVENASRRVKTELRKHLLQLLKLQQGSFILEAGPAGFTQTNWVCLKNGVNIPNEIAI